MTWLLRLPHRVLRAACAAPAHLMEAATAALPAFRWERWTGGSRWLLTSRPWTARQPLRSDVRLWGLGQLTLIRVTC